MPQQAVKKKVPTPSAWPSNFTYVMNLNQIYGGEVCTYYFYVRGQQVGTGRKLTALQPDDPG